MKPFILNSFILVVLAGTCACQKEVTIENQPLMIDQRLQDKATGLAHEWIIFDAHIDVPFRHCLTEKMLKAKWREARGMTGEDHKLGIF